MSKYVKFPAGPKQTPLPDNTKPEGQILAYLIHKYGENHIDQMELQTELNLHQSDGAVTKERQVRPLSQLFAIYAPEWRKGGHMVPVFQKELGGAKQPGKVARMESHIRDLEGLLSSRGIPFNAFSFEKKEAA